MWGLTCGSRDDAVLLGQRRRTARDKLRRCPRLPSKRCSRRDRRDHAASGLVHNAAPCPNGLIAALLRSRTVRGHSTVCSAFAWPLLGVNLPLLGFTSPPSHAATSTPSFWLWSPTTPYTPHKTCSTEYMSCFDVKRCFRTLLTAIASPQLQHRHCSFR